VQRFALFFGLVAMVYALIRLGSIQGPMSARIDAGVVAGGCVVIASIAAIAVLRQRDKSEQ
jgi:hypothetical protein